MICPRCHGTRFTLVTTDGKKTVCLECQGTGHLSCCAGAEPDSEDVKAIGGVSKEDGMRRRLS